MPAEYIISNKEIDRRKMAFLALSLSLLFGFTILRLYLIVLLLLVFILLISNLALYRSSKYFLKIKIQFCDGCLIRIIDHKQEDYTLVDLRKIYIKRTSKGTIREVSMLFLNGKSLIVNGLENFELFWEELMRNTDKSVLVKQYREPMDFDHPIFYPILGLLISLFFVYIFKLLTNLSAENIRIANIAISLYVISVGIYFIYAKPISKRYGNMTWLADVLPGLLMIIAGVWIVVLGIIR